MPATAAALQAAKLALARGLAAAVARALLERGALAERRPVVVPLTEAAPEEAATRALMTLRTKRTTLVA
jgi:hypothetical protein